MIPVPSGVRVWLATGHTDMRNYVMRRIMRSPGWLGLNRTGPSQRSTPHNLSSSPATEHGQELVRGSEPTGREVWS